MKINSWENYNNPTRFNNSRNSDPESGLAKLKKSKLVRAIAITLALSPVFSNVMDRISDTVKPSAISSSHTEKTRTDKRAERQNYETPRSMNEIINFDNPGKIEFDQNTFLISHKNYWKEKFLKNPGFKKGYQKMGQWMPDLTKGFKEHNITKEYIDLTLPEAEFNLIALSDAQAKGPYQFIESSAKAMGLEINNYKDERCDPEKSGEACAKLLKHNFKHSNDPGFALLDYNGTIGRKYYDLAAKKGEQLTIEGFYKTMERRVNEIREDVLNSPSYEYKVKSKTHNGIENVETLNAIANKTKVDISTIASANSISSNAPLLKGQKIIVPLTNNTAKKVYFDRQTSDIKQQMGYLSRFAATTDLVKEGKLGERDEPLAYTKFRAKSHKENIKHTATKNEDIVSFCKSKNIKISDFKKSNPKIKKKININDVVIIPNQTIPATLENIAKKYNISADELQRYNPALKGIHVQLPDGELLRFPKKL